tara:strand:- start:846 stop:1112 length:267 start_codon:yes stop_codon:yes gene_type:complete
MRFEVKTDQNSFLNKLSFTFAIILFAVFSLLLLNISLNLSKLSRSFEINYFCKLILVDKSPKNFRKLSKLTNQLSKQKIWEFCREIAK